MFYFWILHFLPIYKKVLLTCYVCKKSKHKNAIKKRIQRKQIQQNKHTTSCFKIIKYVNKVYSSFLFEKKIKLIDIIANTQNNGVSTELKPRDT